MHLIQSLKNEFGFDLPMFSKYPVTSINSYFHKMTLHIIMCVYILPLWNVFVGISTEVQITALDI